MGPWTALLILFLQSAPGRTTDAPAVPPPEQAHIAWNDYAWPTEAGKIVTSTFGEYRSSHFHAGIDISSGDMQGYGVFASRSGYVSRIRISPTGYGKILYIRHPDGFTTTYAHLERFSPTLDARAAAEQQKLGRYPVDIACAPEEFPVRKGDLVARTGETGAASPHLHFEIRDPAGDPVNPFLAPQLRVNDDIPPTITRIAVSPLSPDGTVDGAQAARIYRARTSRGTTLARIVQPIVITGEAGFALESKDRMPGSRFRNGVYARTLEIDGKEAYAERLDKTPWNEAHEIELCYERGFSGAGRFARLYKDSPNHLPFFIPRSPRAGTIDCAALLPGPHTFRIVSADFQGNSAEVSGTFVASRVPAGSVERSGDTLSVRLFTPADVGRIEVAVQAFRGAWTVRSLGAPPGGFPGTFILPWSAGEIDAVSVTLENRWGTRSHPIIIPPRRPEGTPPAIHLSYEVGEEFVRVRVTADGILPSPPAVTVREGASQSTVVMTAAGPVEYAGWFTPREEYRGARHILASCSYGGGRSADSSAVDLEPVLPGTSGAVTFDGGNLFIRYDSLSVLRTLFLHAEKTAGPDAPVYSLGPSGTVLGSGLLVTIRPGPGNAHRGLFERTGGSWQFVGGREGVNDSACTGRVTGRLGEVTLIADSTPPALVRISVERRAGTGTEIAARFRDDLSGVEYDDLKMYIDGNLVIPEIDGRRRRAVYQAHEVLGRGRHRLAVHLADRMGNSETTERQFVLP
jgi:hypothetical protein